MEEVRAGSASGKTHPVLELERPAPDPVRRQALPPLPRDATPEQLEAALDEAADVCRKGPVEGLNRAQRRAFLRSRGAL